MVCNSTCQLVDGVTSYCGDGGEPDQTNGETCDAGKDNGVACTPVYGGEGCTYCDVMCQTVELSSPYCGDGGVNGTDEYPEACDYGDGNTDGPFEL